MARTAHSLAFVVMGFALLFRTVAPAGFAWAARACGNGIVEGGEECDPGGELHCDGSRGTNPPFVKGGLGSCAPANATLAMNVQTPDKRADKVVVASRTPPPFWAALAAVCDAAMYDPLHLSVKANSHRCVAAILVRPPIRSQSTLTSLGPGVASPGCISA